MVRMSDILKRAKEKERKAREKKQMESSPESLQQKVSPEPVKEVISPKPEAYEVKRPTVEKQKREKTETSEVRISPVVRKEDRIASFKESMDLYKEMVSLMREILKENVDYNPIEIKRVTAGVEKIVNQLELGNEKMLILAYAKDSIDENYLLCHSVNVCIFSVEIGLKLGYEKSKLVKLGISGLLHDIGMRDYLRLVNRAKKLTSKEYNEVKKHSIKGSEFLEKIRDIDRTVIHVAHQQHERIDGSGYPRGLKGDFINEYAKIVSLVDVYEAMLHPRLYRKEFSSLETIQEILDKKKTFEYKLIKTLIERLGIFPLGSIVELSTKEIAQVVKLNHMAPLRPVVRILYDAKGKELKEMRVLDLITQPTIYIRKAIRKKEIEIKEWKQ